MVKDEWIENGDELFRLQRLYRCQHSYLCLMVQYVGTTGANGDTSPQGHANVLGCLILGSAVKRDTRMELAQRIANNTTQFIPHKYRIFMATHYKMCMNFGNWMLGSVLWECMPKFSITVVFDMIISCHNTIFICLPYLQLYFKCEFIV